MERNELNQIPSYNLYSDLVYATKASGVQTVIINGRIIMQDRRLLTLDEATIRATARVFRERILTSLSNPTSQE